MREDERGRHGEQADRRQQRADGEHHDEHADDREGGGDQLGEALLQRRRDVVDVVGHAAEDIAARVLVEVLEGQPGELLIHAPPQAVDGALRHPCHGVLLHPGEDGARKVDGDQRQQDALQGAEIHAVARVQVHRGEHLGERVLALRPECRDGLRLCPAGRQPLADHAREQDVGRVAEDLWAKDGEGHAHHTQHQHDRDAAVLRLEHADQASDGSLEVLWLLGRHHQGVAGRAAARPEAPWPAGLYRPARTACRPWRAHDACSSPSCEATISR